ncbi:unnamed protein product [Paramecium primaurelia]|uniref:Uncharacterized protein n=1 Tax=Paramecium primaurelia TaxID=5886 RepID=A0A8S1K4I4_PARPR|nr:unnamed protein product [Paramecium primaurelia]
MSISINSLKYQDKGVLVDLPTITEIGKTTNTRQCGDKVVCDRGLTPHTFDIRKNFHRKKSQIDYGEIQKKERRKITFYSIRVHEISRRRRRKRIR